MHFFSKEIELASSALINVMALTEPGSRAEYENVSLLNSHPFFKLWTTQEAGQRSGLCYEGRLEGEVGRFFTPEVFNQFQVSFEAGLRLLQKSPRSFIGAKLDLLASIKGISNLNWEVVANEMGNHWLGHFLWRWQEFIEGTYPRQLTIILTNHCNQKCKFCFSSELAADEPGYLSSEMMGRVLTWVKDNQIKHISLFGGEPTLHPRFHGIVQAFTTRGYQVYFATNGLYSDEVARGLVKLDLLKVTFSIPTSGEIKQQSIDLLRKNLHGFPSHIQKVFRVTLSHLDRDLKLIRQLSEEFNPHALSFALAFPSFSSANSYVKPDQTSHFAEEIIELGRIAMTRSIPCVITKPIPLCDFLLDDLLTISRIMELCNVCDIHQNDYAHLVTLSPRGDFYPCMALPQYRRFNIRDNPAYRDLQTYNQMVIKELERHVPMSKCLRCNLKRAGLCQGLCYIYNAVPMEGLSLQGH